MKSSHHLKVFPHALQSIEALDMTKAKAPLEVVVEVVSTPSPFLKRSERSRSD
jgi:hypothetical protein